MPNIFRSSTELKLADIRTPKRDALKLDLIEIKKKKKGVHPLAGQKII